MKTNESPHLCIQQFSHNNSLFMYDYHLKRVTQTTKDLLTTTLPLNNSTTIVGDGQIDVPTARLCEPYK